MSLNYIIVGGYSQDAYYLTELILRKKNTKVYLIVKKKRNITYPHKNIIIKEIDILNHRKIKNFLEKFQNCKIIYLASKNISSEQKENSKLLYENIDINVKSLVYFLEFIKNHKNKFKLFYACSSQIFNNTNTIKQSEKTKTNYTTDYGLSKDLGCRITKYYRERKNVFVSTGILYSHYSKFTKKTFLLKKFSVFFRQNLKKKIFIRNSNSILDFLHASEVAGAILKIIDLKKPDEFIISSYKPLKIKKIFDIFKKISKSKNKEFSDKKNLIKNNVKLIGNNRKIMKSISWKPLDVSRRIKLIFDNE